MCRAVAQSVRGSAGTRGLVLAHLSFIEDLDDGLEIDGWLVGQLLEPLRHGDQGGSRARVRADPSYETVGRAQAELFGSIRHVRTLRCANSTRPNWFRLVQSRARLSPRAALGVHRLQSGIRTVAVRPAERRAVETGAIGPVDPRPPQPGQRAAKAGAWSRVLQASYVRSQRKLTCEPLAAIQNYFRRAACCAHAAAGR